MMSDLITTIDDCCLKSLPTIGSNRKGNITPIYNGLSIPFNIKRVYYLYDIPSGSTRGGHAHKNLHQLIIAATGSFDVIINDGEKEKAFNLNSPNRGLYIPNMLWRELVNFSGGSICLVLASMVYDEYDYYRDQKEFKRDKLNEKNTFP